MNKSNLSTELIPTQALAGHVESLISFAGAQRQSFERKWYDNNFFDDGHHFRYLSRTTGKIVDAKDTPNAPTRAIPKASRQIRGIANLLLQPDFTPVIYPEKITKITYPDDQAYLAAMDAAKQIAQKSGHWLMEEWKNQELKEKIMLMVILAAKNYISYMQIWPDAVEEKIRTQVYDAFDIYLVSNLTSIYDSPFIAKVTPQLIAQIKANENFNPDVTAKITPDNKLASSEIKQAYLQSKYKTGQESDTAATLLLKEVFIKEYLSDYNREDVTEKGKKYNVIENKKDGDVVMRHAFVAGGMTLLDEYVDLPEYPFVDFRFEPGPIYGTSLIERFIPMNKSLDLIASRVERFTNTMTTGTWLTRSGEDLEITNIPGGQKLSYKGTPPTQAQMATIPPHVFNMMGLYENWIDEQGAASAAMNQLPTGVKSGVAIESIKQTEYANLKIASTQLSQTVRRISERMLDIADNHFINPQTVYLLEDGEPQYFDIIGQRGVDVRNKINATSPGSMPIPEAVPIKGEYRVTIEVQSGLGFTEEGKKKTMQEIINFITQMAQLGVLTTDSLKVVVTQFLKTYNFGATQDFMNALDTGNQSMPLNEDQITQMKIAFAEVAKDLGLAGEEQDEKQITTTKVGVAEALQDLAN